MESHYCLQIAMKRYHKWNRMFLLITMKPTKLSLSTQNDTNTEAGTEARMGMFSGRQKPKSTAKLPLILGKLRAHSTSISNDVHIKTSPIDTNTKEKSTTIWYPISFSTQRCQCHYPAKYKSIKTKGACKNPRKTRPYLPPWVFVKAPAI